MGGKELAAQSLGICALRQVAYVELSVGAGELMVHLEPEPGTMRHC
jgi:hypothetical protein